MRNRTRTVRPFEILVTVALSLALNLALSLAAALVASPREAFAGDLTICGDVNNNGTIATSDALLVLKTAVGQPTDLVCESCSSVQGWGQTTQLSSEENLGGGYLLGNDVKITVPATVTRLGLFSKSVGANFQMALYADNDGAPGRLIVGSNVASLVKGQQEVAVTPTPIAPGFYWIMAAYADDVTMIADLGDSGAKVRFGSFTVGNSLPNPFGGSALTTGLTLNYYMRVIQ